MHLHNTFIIIICASSLHTLLSRKVKVNIRTRVKYDCFILLLLLFRNSNCYSDRINDTSMAPASSNRANKSHRTIKILIDAYIVMYTNALLTDELISGFRYV